MKPVFKKNLLFALLFVLISSMLYLEVPVVYAATCGSGGCETGENMFSCPSDCPPPVGVPTKPIPDVLDDAAKWLVGFSIMAAVAVLVWSGITYSSSSGDSEKTTTAKKYAKYVLIGILAVGISYAIIKVIDDVLGP